MRLVPRATRPLATEDTPCALCGSRDDEPIAAVDRDGQGLSTVLCRVCGLVRTNPRPSEASMAAYYASTYRADYQRQAAPTRRKVLRGFMAASDRWRVLRRFLPEGMRAIDVGSGAGEFVLLLRQRRIDASGIEPGAAYAEFSRLVMGVPVQTATIETAVVDTGAHDLVTMFHVLEHVAHPRRTLEAVRGWLRKDGLLVVEVPNVLSTVQAPKHRFHFAHLYGFSEATLGALGEAAGLRLVRSCLSSDGGNVTCVFRRGSDERHETTTSMSEHVEQVRIVLRGHTTMRHYLSGVPYGRTLARLGRRIEEDRVLRRLPTMDAVLAWARDSVAADA